MRLPTITCRCGREIISAEFEQGTERSLAPQATSYASCLRKCTHCGYGFSNANTNDMTKLASYLREPFAGIPDEIIDGHDCALAEALNVRNRRSKVNKLASINSEDHVTWTVFRFLQMGHAITPALAAANVLPSLDAQQIEPTMLLWGSPIPLVPAGTDLRQRLENLCDSLGENPVSRSEPDVILDFAKGGIVFIEVKLHSQNDWKPADYKGEDGTSKWDKYLVNTNAFRDVDATRDSGLYELTRNWRLAWELADGRPMCVINLGPAKLNKGLSKWLDSLARDARHQFLFLSWATMIGTMKERPQWFANYLIQRRVIETP